MYCTNCGKQIDNNSMYCPYCGKQLKGSIDPRLHKKNRQSKRKTNNGFPVKKIWLVLIFLVAAAALGLIYRHFSNNTSDIKIIAYYEPVNSEKIVYEEGKRFISSHLLLTAKEGTDYGDIEALVRENDGKIIGYISLTQDYQILFENEKDLDSLNNRMEVLKNSSMVDAVSLENVFEVDADTVDQNADPWKPTSDPSIEPSWYEVPKGSNWWSIAINMPEVWKLDYKFKKVKVGLIDTYFDSENDDLRDAFAMNGIIGQENVNVAAEYTNAVAEEKKGNKPKISSSDYAHGSHTAGIIGARNNSSGICGINQNAELYGVSLFGNDDNWNISTMSFKYAIASLLAEGVKVINISMGFEEEFVFAANMEASGKDKRTTKALEELKEANDSISEFLKKCLKHYDFLIVKAAGNASNTEHVETAIDGDHPYGYRDTKKDDSTIDLLSYKKMKCDAKYDFLSYITDNDIKNHIIVVGAVDCITNFIGFFEDDSYSESKLQEFWKSQNELQNYKSKNDFQDFLEFTKVTPQIRMYYAISDFSNIGERVDIYAPGGSKGGNFGKSSIKVLSDFPNDEVGLMAGTSQAAPMVAGVASLIWGVDPNLTALEVRDILLESADDQYGLLTVNAIKSVTSVYGHDPEYDQKLEEASFFMGITYETVTDSSGKTETRPVNSQVVIEDKNGKKISDIQVLDKEFTVDLVPGTYYVTVTAQGYKTIQDTIIVEKEKTCFKAYDLKREEKEDDDVWKIVTKDENEAEENKENNNSDPYREIIEQYREIMAKGYDAEELGSIRYEYPQINIDLLQDAYINQYGVSYCLYDVNQDGTEELLISSAYNNDSTGAYFYALYTQGDGQLIPLITDCAYRTVLYICEDGSIIKRGSGGALYGEASVYNLDDSGEKLVLNSVYDIDYEKYPNSPYFNGEERLAKEEFDMRYRMVDPSSFAWLLIE